jgi:hypothetical protein
MRTTAFVLAAFIASSSAAAQSWQEYSYPEYAFTVVFPANPHMETTTYQAADNRAVPAHVYSVTQNNGVFKITVADIRNTGLDEQAIIDHAIKMLSAGGEVKYNIPQRIDSVYGRLLGIAGANGSNVTAAMFDYNGRLYQIEAKVLAAGSDTAAEALRFEQSLVFTDGGSNRSADLIRAYRQACPGTVGPPAGFDDPRCHAKAP